MNQINKLSAFQKGDIDAAIGTFFDSFSKIIIAISLLIGTFHFPKEIVFGRIITATGATVFLFSIFTFSFSLKTGKTAQNKGITSLFAGVSSTTFYVWLNAIMLPVFFETKDALLAWSVTVAVSFIYALLQIVLAFFLESVFQYVPTEALRGAVIGSCIAWMLISTAGDAFSHPMIILPTLFILLIFFLGKIQTRFVSPALIAIAAGTIIAWISGVGETSAVKASLDNLGFYFPILNTTIFQAAVFKKALSYLPLIIAFLLSESTSNMQALAEAKALGDVYPAKTALLGLGIGNLLGSLLGNPFLLNYYWGYTAWKEVKAGSGYSLLSGTLHLMLCLTGIAAIVAAVIPSSVSLVMLIFIGIASGSAAFANSKKRYYPAMLFGAAIPIFELINNKIMSLSTYIEEFSEQAINPQILTDVGYSSGYTFLAQGSMTIAILYTSIIIMIIDHKWLKAAIFSCIAALCSFFGLIHASVLSINANLNYTLMYIFIALGFLLLYLLKRIKN